MFTFLDGGNVSQLVSFRLQHCSDSPSVIVLLQPQEISDPYDLYALQSDDDDDGFVEGIDSGTSSRAGSSSYIVPCLRFKRELRMDVNERLLSSSEDEEQVKETCRCKLVDFYRLTRRRKWRRSKGELYGERGVFNKCRNSVLAGICAANFLIVFDVVNVEAWGIHSLGQKLMSNLVGITCAGVVLGKKESLKDTAEDSLERHWICYYKRHMEDRDC